MKTTAISILAALLLAAPVLADPAGEKQTITGGYGLNAKGVLGIGFSPCVAPDLAECPPDTAVFDVSSWNADPGNDGARLVTFWANWRGGVFGPGDTGGFEMFGCSDRNDNSLCGDSDDDIGNTFSNRAVVGDCSKDDKDCGDNTDAELVLCIREDTAAGGGDFDRLHVFIGQWADVGLGGNTGAGISYGTYDVFMDAGSWSGC